MTSPLSVTPERETSPQGLVHEDAARTRARAARLRADLDQLREHTGSSALWLDPQRLAEAAEAVHADDGGASARMAARDVEAVAATASATVGTDDDAAVSGAREAVVSASATTGPSRFRAAARSLPVALYARAMARHSVNATEDETQRDRTRMHERHEDVRPWDQHHEGLEHG